MQVQDKDKDGNKRTYVILTKDNYSVEDYEKARRGYEVAEQNLREVLKKVSIDAQDSKPAQSYIVDEAKGFGADDPRARLSQGLQRAPYFDSIRKTAVEEKDDDEEKRYQVGE